MGLSVRKQKAEAYKVNQEDILAYFNKILELDPKDANAWYYKGNALARLGRCDEAAKCYDKALEIDPKNPNALEWIKAKLSITKNKENK